MKIMIKRSIFLAITLLLSFGNRVSAASNHTLYNDAADRYNNHYLAKTPSLATSTLLRQGIACTGALASYNYLYPKTNLSSVTDTAKTLFARSIKIFGISQGLQCGLGIAQRLTKRSPLEGGFDHYKRILINQAPAVIAPVVAFNAIELKNNFSLLSTLKTAFTSLWFDLGPACILAQ